MREKIGPVAAFKLAITVPRLPKTRSGKILRGTMKKIADGESWTMPATIEDPEVLEEIGIALKEKGTQTRERSQFAKANGQIEKWEGCHAHRSILRRFAWIICLNLPAQAQGKYPVRPVKFVVSFSAGGPNDIIARVLCDWLSDHFGQQFVVENRTGAGGNVGAQSVINSAPDGYTVMFVGPNNAISQSLFKKLPFDFMRDTAPVGGIMTLINIMVVPPSLPVNTVAEFVAYAKAHPGTINMASGGAGTSPHMAGELFRLMTGIEMLHVPYRGTGPADPGSDDQQGAGDVR